MSNLIHPTIAYEIAIQHRDELINAADRKRARRWSWRHRD
ncbi:MAG: hypothetical protein JWN62_2072 [Acidimicrobiales bacterium]|nr:hypothetical protein [Acidimicrobiales bacterium]